MEIICIGGGGNAYVCIDYFKSMTHYVITNCNTIEIRIFDDHSIHRD